MITVNKAFVSINKIARKLHGIGPLLDMEDVPSEVRELVRYGCWDYMMNVTAGYTTERSMELAEYSMERLYKIQKSNAELRAKTQE